MNIETLKATVGFGIAVNIAYAHGVVSAEEVRAMRDDELLVVYGTSIVGSELSRILYDVIVKNTKGFRSWSMVCRYAQQGTPLFEFAVQKMANSASSFEELSRVCEIVQDTEEKFVSGVHEGQRIADVMLSSMMIRAGTYAEWESILRFVRPSSDLTQRVLRALAEISPIERIGSFCKYVPPHSDIDVYLARRIREGEVGRIDALLNVYEAAALGSLLKSVTFERLCSESRKRSFI